MKFHWNSIAFITLLLNVRHIIKHAAVNSGQKETPHRRKTSETSRGEENLPSCQVHAEPATEINEGVSGSKRSASTWLTAAGFRGRNLEQDLKTSR